MGKLESILKADPVIWKSVNCPEWKPADAPEGEEFVLWIRPMPGPDFDAFQKWAIKKNNAIKKDPFVVNLRFLRSCVYDERNGEPTFKGCDRSELEALNPAARERCLEVAMALSGVTQKDIEELTGN